MAEIRTTRFHGMRTALHNTLQPGEGQGAAFADVARNTLLTDGAIRALRGDAIVQTIQFTAKTIAKLPAFTCCPGLYALPYCASVVDAPAAGCCPCDDQIIVFGSECCQDGSTAHKRCDPCTGECWPLVIPSPRLPPVIQSISPTDMLSCGHSTASGCTALRCSSSGSSRVSTGDNVKSGHGAEETAYVYTWVDRFGVETPPSPPSRVVTKWDDQAVTLSNMAVSPPAGALFQRIYRAVRDYPITAEPNVGAASWQLVAERRAPFTDIFIDDNRLCNLPGGTLLTTENCPPPECMEQVVLTESGYYVGFTCNELRMSERHEPWNWPERYVWKLPDRIVAVAVLGDTIFIGTSGTPYRAKIAPQYGGINDGLPSQERIQGFDTRVEIEPFQEAYPCIGRDTMVATAFGAMYATDKGLVALRVDAGYVSLVTKDRIDPERWREWAPVRAVWHRGHYLGYRPHSGKGFMLEVPGDARRMEFGDFVEVDFNASLLHAGRDGKLYGVNGNNIVWLFEANTQRTYNWRSRVFRAASYTQMGAAKVVALYGPPVEFKLYVGGRLAYTRLVRDSRPFRLPKVARHTDFVIEVTGVTTINELHIGLNLRALATNATSAGSGQGLGETLA